MLTDAVLDQVTEFLVSVANPRRVFVFASQARGDASADSDVDLMVIVPDQVDDLRGLRTQIHLGISSLIAIPCDILIEHESTFRLRSALPTIERTVLETGRTLYAA